MKNNNEDYADSDHSDERVNASEEENDMKTVHKPVKNFRE